MKKRSPRQRAARIKKQRAQNRKTFIPKKDSINTPFRGQALLCFLDLLGFTRSVQATWERDGDILPVILDLKKAITEGAPLYVGYEGTDVKSATPIVWTISDSIILLKPMSDPCSEIEFISSLFGMWGAIVTALQRASNAGFAIRGALDAGRVYWHKQELIGPLFNIVYTMESNRNIAQSARILCGPNLIKVLSEWAPQHWDLIRQMFYECEDGLLAVGPFPIIQDKMKELREQAGNRLAHKYAEYFYGIENYRPDAEHRFEKKTFDDQYQRIADLVNDALGVDRTGHGFKD